MRFIVFTALALFLLSCGQKPYLPQAEITPWKDHKKGAVSLTYDDGTINQFTVAMPIMDKLGFPGTFYVITGKIPGSKYHGQFLGRDIKAIIRETATVPTSASNFFERASAIGFSGYEGAIEYHSKAGSLIDSGKPEEAYAVIDEGYAKIRKGQMKSSGAIIYHHNTTDTTTWDDYKNYMSKGHEIASHTVTHPRLAALDETNLLYELEKSREDVLSHLGEAATFSAECPYGTENERVMEYAHKIYPALRNRMPEPYLAELNRASKDNPGATGKEYVQWQRGPVTSVSMETMKSWVDTVLNHNNIWLVLVFHGVDGIGWEPRTGAELEEYFGYIKGKEEGLWVETFAKITQYLRERKGTTLESQYENNAIQVKAQCSLDSKMYNVPLTFRVNLPKGWDEVTVRTKDGKETLEHRIEKTEEASYVLFNALPYQAEVTIEGK